MYKVPDVIKSHELPLVSLKVKNPPFQFLGLLSIQTLTVSSPTSHREAP